MHVYGVFIDFSNAYNTVKHNILIDRVKNALSEPETEYLKALLSNIKIKAGKSIFHPNRGVPQGSIISPALFNIYLEPLLREIEELGISPEDILAYADDVLILCTSPNSVRTTIQLIKKWRTENGLILNPKKSEILEFTSRRGEPYYKIGKEVEEIPIVSKYRYLGCWLNSTLTMDDQLEKFETASRILRVKLGPALYANSMTYRRNMWLVFVSPWIEFFGPLYLQEDAIYRKLKVDRAIRKTIKHFLGFKKNVKNDLIYKIIGFEPVVRFNEVWKRSKVKWERRKKGESMEINNEEKIEKPLLMKWVPKEFVTYTNTLTAMCPKCERQIMNEFHLTNSHKIEVISPYELLQKLETVYEPKKSRIELMEKSRLMVQEYLDRLQQINV